MRPIPEYRLLTSLILFLISGYASSQSGKPVLVGLQPGITIEPFYEEGELDVNIAPLIVEIPIGERLNFRLLPTVNYHMGGTRKGLSDLGFYTVFPVFIKKRESSELLPYGMYVGPVFGFGRNLINNHYTTTLALEPGYLFETKKSFTISLGCQFGSSHFAYDNQPNKWIFHWGPKVTFGFWLNRPQ